MAEILIKAGDQTGDASKAYRDGDVICAFNARHIRCVHAQHICHVHAAARNGDGLILPTEVVRDWFEATHGFRFDRVTRTRVRRTNLVTLETEDFNATPNADGKAMDVPLFIARRKKKADHYLFGTDGAETWYGGRKDFSNAKMDIVWNAIETKTPKREVDHTQWPFSEELAPQQIQLSVPEEFRKRLISQGQSPPFDVRYFGGDREYHTAPEGTTVTAIVGGEEMREHLVVPVDDFDDAEAENLAASEVDETDPENPATLKRRTHDVNWRALFARGGFNEADVTNRTKRVDVRQNGTLNRSSIVRVKP